MSGYPETFAWSQYFGAGATPTITLPAIPGIAWVVESVEADFNTTNGTAATGLFFMQVGGIIGGLMGTLTVGLAQAITSWSGEYCPGAGQGVVIGNGALVIPTGAAVLLKVGGRIV